MRRLLVVLVTMNTLQGCAGSASDDDMPLQGQTAEESLTAGWTSVGAGVAYKHGGEGDAVWIGYGGYSVQTDWSCAWSDELHRTRLRALGVGHLYAVKGPNDPGYRNREVANTRSCHRSSARRSCGPRTRASDRVGRPTRRR